MHDGARTFVAEHAGGDPPERARLGRVRVQHVGAPDPQQAHDLAQRERVVRADRALQVRHQDRVETAGVREVGHRRLALRQPTVRDVGLEALTTERVHERDDLDRRPPDVEPGDQVQHRCPARHSGSR